MLDEACSVGFDRWKVFDGYYFVTTQPLQGIFMVAMIEFIINNTSPVHGKAEAVDQDVTHAVSSAFD